MVQSRSVKTLSWILRIVAALILLQTLFFKFTGAPESVYIFSQVGQILPGAEPFGRIGSGIIELIASVLLLAPQTVAYGALLSLLTMSGAILSHLVKLGIALPAVGDRGELFMLALIVFMCSAALLILHRAQLPIVVSRGHA